MAQFYNFNVRDLSLTLKHFHPHYIDEFGNENLQVVDAIQEIIAELPNHTAITGGYVLIEDDILFESNFTIHVRNKKFEAGKVVYNMLKKSEQLGFFLCSLGKGMSDWSRRFFVEGDHLMGYLVDLAGSILVDLVADEIEKKIEKEANNNQLSITNRYSPGYCNWSVAEQQALFSFFPENFCGVSLNASSLMMPEKSISGIIGIGKNVKKVPYTCTMCEIENCLYSKSKISA